MIENSKREININIMITLQKSSYILELDNNKEESSIGLSSEDKKITSIDIEYILNIQIINITRTRNALIKKYRL